MECKSFLDSRGVNITAFAGAGDGRPDRYKLFTDSLLCKVVFHRLETQLVDAEFCRPAPNITLCLVAGRVASEQHRDLLKQHFKNKGWQFWDDEWLRDSLHELPKCGYENNVSTVVAKMLLRK